MGIFNSKKKFRTVSITDHKTASKQQLPIIQVVVGKAASVTQVPILRDVKIMYRPLPRPT